MAKRWHWFLRKREPNISDRLCNNKAIFFPMHRYWRKTILYYHQQRPITYVSSTHVGVEYFFFFFCVIRLQTRITLFDIMRVRIRLIIFSNAIYCLLWWRQNKLFFDAKSAERVHKTRAHLTVFCRRRAPIFFKNSVRKIFNVQNLPARSREKSLALN